MGISYHKEQPIAKIVRNYRIGKGEFMKRKIICIIFIILTMAFSKSYSQDNLKLIATMTGEKAGDQFGVVSGVGDVNGDGFDDLLVGAAGGNYAKLYFGGAPFDTVADLKFTGEQLQSLFGNHIAGVGDVNGDGYDDILIGSDNKASLYFGSPDMDTIPDFEFVGKYLPENLALTVAGAGDVNKDGFDDFIIGIPFNEYDLIGRVYLFFGGTILDTIPAITFVGDAAGQDFFGFGIAGCGDTNHDGFDDIIIGAPGGLTGRSIGKVMIYFGGTEMDSVADVTLNKPNNFEYTLFGLNVSYAGDVNGDGFDEFLVLSSNNVYLYLGIDSVYVMPGYSLGTGGDINNDDYNDFLVGNPDYIDNSGVMVGKVCGYYGAALLDTLCDFSMEGEIQWGKFSKYITIAGDINGDGFDEVIVGAPQVPDNQDPVGKIYIYSYNRTDGVDVHENPNYPKGFELNQNYPNPFNSATTISYNLPFSYHTTIEVLDCMGKKIRTLMSGKDDPGRHQVVWDGKDESGSCVSSGIYFIKMAGQSFDLASKKQTKIRKLILLK